MLKFNYVKKNCCREHCITWQCRSHCGPWLAMLINVMCIYGTMKKNYWYWTVCAVYWLVKCRAVLKDSTFSVLIHSAALDFYLH